MSVEERTMLAVEMADIYISYIMMDESIPKSVRTDPCFIVTARYHVSDTAWRCAPVLFVHSKNKKINGNCAYKLIL